MTEHLSPKSLRSPGNASFPSPFPTAGSQQASNTISSQVTDVGSEDDDEFQAEKTTTEFRPGTGASTDPHRPGSALSSQTRPSTRTPPSRRRMGSPRSLNTLRARGTFGGPGSSIQSSSRPTSSTSRISRTHVPALASHAFLRPMSSQRLQAQRSARPVGRQASISGDGTSDTGSNARRNSVLTNTTDLQETTLRSDRDVPPQSRGSEYTERDDRTAINASPEGNGTLGSIGGSDRPLQQSGPVSVNHQRNGTPQKSNKAFSASFMRSNGTVRKETHGREHLPLSNEDSPTFAKPAPLAAPKAGINYQYFSGNTIFCWGGRLLNTKDRPVNIASGIFVVLPSILFLVYSGPYLSNHASPAVPFFFAYLSFICISSFVHASVTDPGILPRNLHPLPPAESDDPLAIPPPLTQWTTIKPAGTLNAALDVPTKYCKTCNIWRPPRCHHCRVCDSCIETQDHHCVWINNCVGRRNYRYFFGFVSSGTLLGFYLMFGSLGHCLRYASMEHVSFVVSINSNRMPFAMFIYSILATPYPACLWGYHLWLTARGETTREYLNSHKFLRRDRHRPFTQGNILKNWVNVLIRPRPPTYLRFKAKYEEGDQRFGPRRGKRQAPLVAEQQGGGMELHNIGGAKHT